MNLPTLSSRVALIATTVLAASATMAAPPPPSPAGSACPDSFFNSGNRADNPDFELPDAGVPQGSRTCWQLGDPLVPTPVAAAQGWKMHSNNVGARVCSTLVKGKAPGPGGDFRLFVDASGNEGGVYQDVSLDPTKSYMFSVWVFAKSGQVAIQSSSSTGGPVAWTSKTNEWEQLRVCNNSQWSANQLVIYNQTAGGGKFYVDRAELREMPQRE